MMKNDVNVFDVISVSIKRGDRWILKDVSFSIESSGIFLIFGPSGSGKTTLLRLLNRLIDPDSGRVLFRGKAIEEIEPRRLRKTVGMVFQVPVMFEGSVEENIKIGGRLWGIDVDAENFLDMVHLDRDILRRNALSLSVGEAQRVSIARALSLKPDVLLMDEPTSSLDPASTLSIEKLIKELNKELGITFVIVSHSIEQIERLGERGILLVKGEIVENGIIQDIISNPKTEKMLKFVQGEHL